MTNKSISQLTAGGAVAGTDLFPDVQTVGVGPVKVTAAQIGDYLLKGTYTSNTLVYDSTNSRIGINTASPFTTLEVNSSSATAPILSVYSTPAAYTAGQSLGVMQIGSNAAGNNVPAVVFTGINETLANSANGSLTIATRRSGTVTEAMRITSAGYVGIGTNAPGANLDVAAGAAIIGIFNGSGADSRIEYKIGGTRYAYHYWNSGEFRSFAGASVVSTFYAGGSEAMRIDNAGNVGIGVVPNTFSGGKAIEIGAAGNAINGYEASNILITAGAYYNSGWKYANSLFAVAEYQQYRGEHRWYNAPSGTTGNAVTFTQAMTLDTSGRLGIATTSPATTLDVNGNIRGAQIYSTPTALTSGATITWNANTSPIATLTLNQVGATLTMSNLVAGSTYILTVTQGAGGSKTITTWTNFKWPSGVAPTLSTAAGAIDVITAYTDGTYLYATAQIGFV